MSMPAYRFTQGPHQRCGGACSEGCPEVATNVAGTVALRESTVPGVVVEFTEEGFRDLRESIKAGDYDYV